MEITDVVAAAADGDEQAWSELVRRYSGLVWSTARSFRLSRQDIEDASQLTWLLLSLHIRTLRDPQAISGWLVTTARRESLRLAQRRHETLLDHEQLDAPDRTIGEVDDGLLREEVRAQVRRGFAELDERCQRLLRLLARDPPARYSDISATLDLPVGSIGPIRARCLQRLRRASGF